MYHLGNEQWTRWYENQKGHSIPKTGEDSENIKIMDLNEIRWRIWIGFIYLRIGTDGGFL
jgi:hypothetical protein